MELGADIIRTAGALLVSIVAVEYGGIFVLGIHRKKRDFTDFQLAFFRAGHAHAGVLLVLSLVALLYLDSLDVAGWSRVLGRSAIPAAAILMPAGFFFSAAGRGRTRPSGWIALVYLGAVSLATGVLTIGISLLTS